MAYRPDINEIAHELLDKLNQCEVISTGCWIHNYATTKHGYVSLRYYKNGRDWGYHAHRVSYAIHKGVVPADMDVCHVCDIRNCVNPDHLFLGTRTDNNQDMIKKHRGNGRYGKQITEEEEEFIVFFRSKGYSYTKIGLLLDVDQSTVGKTLKRINRGKL